MKPVSILLICEQAEQVTGSGCCGKLGGDMAGPADCLQAVRPAERLDEFVANDVFRESKRQRRGFGLLYRAVKEVFPPENGKERDVGVSVDPRNQLYLAPKLVHEAFRHRPGWINGLVTSLQLFSLPAVVVNGRVISRRGNLVPPDELCHVVRKALGETVPADATVS
ncbi:MAG: hypothetical protein N2C14_28840 [Planctomycetales bacterium]